MSTNEAKFTITIKTNRIYFEDGGEDDGEKQAMPDRRLRVLEADIQLAIDTLANDGDVCGILSQLEGLMECAPQDHTPDLLLACKCALADLEGALLDYDIAVDGDAPMAKTVRELRAVIQRVTGRED